jgi:hypothetical protein
VTEQDIRGGIAVIAGALDAIDAIDKAMVNRGPTAAEREQAENLRRTALTAALGLGANVLVNLNDIAEALKFVASQHNNSEALFRG